MAMDVPSKFAKRSKYSNDLCGIIICDNSVNIDKAIKKKTFRLKEMLFPDLIRHINDK